MTREELKKIIEREVSKLVGETLREPEPQKVQEKESKPTKRRSELSEEELDNFMFHGQSKVNKDKHEELPRATSHL